MGIKTGMVLFLPAHDTAREGESLKSIHLRVYVGLVHWKRLLLNLHFDPNTELIAARYKRFGLMGICFTIVAGMSLFVVVVGIQRIVSAPHTENTLRHVPMPLSFVAAGVEL